MENSPINQPEVNQEQLKKGVKELLKLGWSVYYSSKKEYDVVNREIGIEDNDPIWEGYSKLSNADRLKEYLKLLSEEEKSILNSICNLQNVSFDENNALATNKKVNEEEVLVVWKLHAPLKKPIQLSEGETLE